MAVSEAVVICAGGTWMTTGQMRYTGNGAGTRGNEERRKRVQEREEKEEGGKKKRKT